MLSIVKPPYTGQPSTIANVFWAGGMALDQSDDIFLAQGIAPRSKITYFKEYLAPDYTQSVRFATSKQRFITAVTALPNGLLAVGSVRNGPNDTSLPGNLTIYSPPYTKAPTRIAALTFVSAMTVVPKGLIVVVCSQCFTQSGGAYLALVAPPFTSVTKILAKLPNVTAPAIYVHRSGRHLRKARRVDLPVRAAVLQGSETFEHVISLGNDGDGTKRRPVFRSTQQQRLLVHHRQTAAAVYRPAAGTLYRLRPTRTDDGFEIGGIRTTGSPVRVLEEFQGQSFVRGPVAQR